MLKGRLIFLFFLSIIIGTSGNYIKYKPERGNWKIADHPDRVCREDESMYECTGIEEKAKICSEKETTPRNCVENLQPKCNDDEIQVKRWCMPRYRITRLQMSNVFGNMYLPCHPTEFACEQSHVCIPRSWVQDGQEDCHLENLEYDGDLEDDSDERSTLQWCYEDTEFRCDNGRCLPRSWVMDGNRDCKNGEDEIVALNCKNHTEFACKRTNRCILRRYVNDGINDCHDGTDENVTVDNFACIDEFEFSCKKIEGVGRCIPKQWINNQHKDCIDGEDETNLPLECYDEGFTCLDQTRCLPKMYLCDGLQQCKDGSDEVELCSSPTMYRYNKTRPLIPWSVLLFETNDKIIKFYPDFQPQHDLVFGMKCYVNKIVGKNNVEFNKLRTIPQSYIYSNISLCSNKEDDCFDAQSKFTCARCLDGTIISKSQLCDDVIDCADLSDECTCEESKTEQLCEHVFSFQNKSKENKLDLDQICNGVNETKGGIDEQYCNTEVLNFNKGSDKEDMFSNFTCFMGIAGNFSTSENTTKPVVFCDGVRDCHNWEDECSSVCLMRHGRDNNRIKMCHGFIIPHSTYDNAYEYTTKGSKTGKEQILNFLTTNDEENEINPEHVCRYRFFVSKSNAHFVLKSGSNDFCMQTHDFDNLDFLCNISGGNCPWLYSCDDKARSIEIWRKCDHKIDCADNSDEANCSSKTHYYCKSGNPLFISSSQVSDGRSDCSDHSDESKETAFSSETEMLKSIVFRVFVWFFAVAVIVCNIIVLGKHFRKLSKIPSKNSVQYANTYLLISLAFSDVIFGFILLAIGIKSLQFSGQYYAFDMEWRSSLGCNMIGFFTVISSQTSMNLLVLMTGLRFYATHWPFTPPEFKHILRLSVVCLGISALFASFPLWLSEFISSVHIRPNIFIKVDVAKPSRFESYVRRTEAIALLTNFSHIDSESQHDTFSSQMLSNWFFNSEKAVADFPNRQIHILGSFGYYSQSAVCFPNYYSHTPPESHYSLFIILYDLLSLILIGLGYFLIFRRATNSSSTFKTANAAKVNKKNRKTMTKILLIVVTDFICWLPVIVMSISSYNGYVLPDIVHPLSSIVLLPINSIINPIILSRIDKAIIRCLKKYCSCPTWNKCCQTKEEKSDQAVEIELRKV